MTTDCNVACNAAPDTVQKPGPTTAEGKARALANLVPGGRLEHGGWRWMRRGELPMPWGPDVALEIDEMRSS